MTFMQELYAQRARRMERYFWQPLLVALLVGVGIGIGWLLWA